MLIEKMTTTKWFSCKRPESNQKCRFSGFRRGSSSGSSSSSSNVQHQMMSSEHIKDSISHNSNWISETPMVSWSKKWLGIHPRLSVEWHCWTQLLGEQILELEREELADQSQNKLPQSSYAATRNSSTAEVWTATIYSCLIKWVI